MTPARRAGLAVAAVLLLAGPASAVAACPPFTGQPALLERLAARYAGRTTPLTPGELEDFLRREKVPPFSVEPPSGPAPLTVRVRWLVPPVEKPVRIEFDVDGDGSAEWTATDYYGRAEHTYQRPGRYDFTVWIHEPGGRVLRLSTPVEVVSRADFERDLDARWNDLKDALRRGDVAGALDCVHSGARRKYEAVFRALAGTMDVDRELTSIRFVEQYSGIAIYEMLRTRPGGTFSYEIRFAVDGDAVWRLSSM